ncbi:MAG: leucine dehydrogenase [Blastocatellia bacterium AA13]|nr:MAG: leucine dehydrogenase [Blastocatellia bacterium AA13]
MTVMEWMKAMGHEQVVFGRDPKAGYNAIIAIHSTALGPSLGGARLWSYATDDDAMVDALRLSKGMTYKNAVAGIPFGGGKSVILSNGGATDREKLFRAHGRFVDTLGGRYITAEDVGTSPADMEYVRLETRHVGGLRNGSGDPSPLTARGVLRAIQASAKFRWGSEDLSGKTVAVQGCGHVGYSLMQALKTAGARLIVSDVNAELTSRAASELDAEVTAPEAIYTAEADIFAPCALGGILNSDTIPRLKVEIVAGAANNQLLEPGDGDALELRKILYAPDYVANAGGVLNGCIELLGWSREHVAERIDHIYDTMMSVFRLAAADGIPAYRAADRLAEQRLAAANPD